MRRPPPLHLFCCGENAFGHHRKPSSPSLPQPECSSSPSSLPGRVLPTDQKASGELVNDWFSLSILTARKYKMDFKYLSQMKLSNGLYKTTVRLARLWESTNPNMNDALMSLDFMVVDEMGTPMHGMIKAQDIPSFNYQLEEGDVYSVSNFIVSPAREKFRPIPENELMLIFTGSTSISRHLENITKFPRHKFFFTEFHEIQKRVNKDEYLTDAIGHIVSVSRLSEAHAKNRLTTKKNVKIQDLSERALSVTLWGSVAETFPEGIILGKDKPVIVIFARMTVRLYRGEIHICSSSATKFYIDLEIAEVTRFRQKVDPLHLAALMPNREFATMSPTEEALDNKITLSEVESLDWKSHQDTKFSCRATIIDIDIYIRWLVL